MNSHGVLRSAVWIVEAVPFALLCGVFRLLPVATAARIGAATMAFIGMRIDSKVRHIHNNLKIVLGRASDDVVDDARIEATARDVWRNLGAVIAEYPHLMRIARERTTVLIPDSVKALLARGQPCVVWSAHLGNWEILPILLADLGMRITVVYSPQANPLIERLIAFMRPHRLVEFVAKLDAAREMLRALGRNRSLGVLADLRVDSGPSLPFFGIGAATTIVPARLAQRRGYPLVAAHVVREPDSRFHVVFEEPIFVEGDAEGTAERVTVSLLQMLERWIESHPGQWLCTKRRWPRPPRARRTSAAGHTTEGAPT